eukprot:m.340287 g.340287  ORF g.340287 m.340287 type:complete len:133 (+) comp55761_c0_seq15:781-1179(+)
MRMRSGFGAWKILLCRVSSSKKMSLLLDPRKRKARERVVLACPHAQALQQSFRRGRELLGRSGPALRFAICLRSNKRSSSESGSVGSADSAGAAKGFTEASTVSTGLQVDLRWFKQAQQVRRNDRRGLRPDR